MCSPCQARQTKAAAYLKRLTVKGSRVTISASENGVLPWPDAGKCPADAGPDSVVG